MFTFTSEVVNTSPTIELNLFTGEPLAAEAPCSARLPESLVQSFAAATGWELGVKGDRVEIIDMSADWPARTPTAHRGKCDQLAAEISKLLERDL